MRSLTTASRALVYYAFDQLGRGQQGDAAAALRAEVLTPLAKAWGTDVGCEVASLGIQVHGGMGYIEETGAAQHLRDARIAPIYEGTNGIQAADLVGRKLGLDGGLAFDGLIAEVRADAADPLLIAAVRPGRGRRGDAARHGRRRPPGGQLSVPDDDRGAGRGLAGRAAGAIARRRRADAGGGATTSSARWCPRRAGWRRRPRRGRRCFTRSRPKRLPKRSRRPR